MTITKQYFQEQDDSPPPLIATTHTRVRFEEVDALGMVWHGRYSSYFEDGRMAFGDAFGLTYHLFLENRTVAPVVQLHFDYKRPLHFDETISIETSLHWTEAARLNFSYRIQNSEGQLAASGYSVQLFTETDGTVILVTPPWLLDFQGRWREGKL